MLDEYMKSVDNLTINPENRLLRKVETLEAKSDEIAELRLEMQKMKNRIALV